MVAYVPREFFRQTASDRPSAQYINADGYSRPGFSRGYEPRRFRQARWSARPCSNAAAHQVHSSFPRPNNQSPSSMRPNTSKGMAISSSVGIAEPASIGGEPLARTLADVPNVLAICRARVRSLPAGQLLLWRHFCRPTRGSFRQEITRAAVALRPRCRV